MKILELTSYQAQTFEAFQKKPKKVENLFVITHLGQLKQMESLIVREQLVSNGLIVLYASTNLHVPQMVHDKANVNLYDFLVFVEIPVKIGQANLQKLKKMESIYRILLSSTQPKSLYLNSFEGHYSILTTLARKKKIKNILVEEGTATYKLLIHKNPVPASNGLDYKLLKNKFMSTVGGTELFKRMVKRKKYVQDVAVQSRKFFQEVLNDDAVQEKLIHVLGSAAIKNHKKPFVKFDEVYASFPRLIQDGFGVNNVKQFNIYDSVSDSDTALAQEVIELYGITENDVLYVSQRYGVNAAQYVNCVCEILIALPAIDKKRVFIKLHPKESIEVLTMFRKFCVAFKNRFILIEDNRFLIEPVIKASKISTVVGLTSTTLVYAPLISQGTRSISIAQVLMDKLPKNKQNIEGSKVIAEHLEIIRVFDNIEFL